MTYTIKKPDGKVVFDDADQQIVGLIAIAYANTLNAVVSIEQDGQWVADVEPSPGRRTNQSYSFERGQCLVRCYPEDKPVIYEIARMLNEAREAKTGS